jgi:predicted permease
MEIIRTTLADARFALRLLAKNPGFALVAILTLALGIGANAAAFSWIQNVILRTVPGVVEPSRLLVVAPRHASGSLTDTMSFPDIRDLNARKDIFDGVIASQFSLSSLKLGQDQTWIWGQVVSSNYFELLGVKPVLGRVLLPEENTHINGDPVVVLSHAFWRRQFGSDPKIVGQTIELNSTRFTVVGVAPADFLGTMGGLTFDFWAPLTMRGALSGDWNDAGIFESRGARWMHTIARLAPGVSAVQAQAAVATLSKSWEKEFPTSHRDQRLELFPLWNSPWGAPRVMLPLLTVLFAVTVLVLLVVAANFANLLLARAASRAREISVRMALGGSRARLIRQLLTESVTLSTLGCLLGIPCAMWLTEMLGAMFPRMYLPLALNARLDPQGLIFMLVVALAIGVLFGLAPAWHSSRADLFAGLKEGGRGNSSARLWLRSGLIVAQLALALLLVIGGALCFQSFQYAKSMNRGFEPNGVLLGNIRLFVHGYDEKTGPQFYQRLAERIREIPGVESSALGDYVPLGPEGGSSSRISVEGYAPRVGENMGVYFNKVTPGYFATLRIPLLEGRDFRDSDDASAAAAIIVNQTFAQRFWPGQNPVGRKMTIFGNRPVTVIGVAGDTKLRSLNEAAQPYFYLNLRQFYTPNMNIHLRVAADPMAFMGALREAVRSVDPAVYPAILAPMSGISDFAIMPFRISAVVLAALGATALFLAVMGIYGLIAFSVQQRTLEIGIRMALGARAADVLGMILKQGLALALLGVGFGLAGAFALTRLMGGVLVGVTAMDPLTFAAAAVFFIGVALLACYLPARRAASVNPMVALKHE